MPDNALLVPLTAEARAALGGRDHAVIDRLPFRIGRESRMAMIKGELTFMERRKGDAPPNNELYLVDQGHLLNISRQHLQIEKAPDGGLVVHDRGSACGTLVDGKVIGGMDKEGSLPLANDSEIIIGTPDSPYRFTVKNLDALQNPDL